ncbi:somatostatin receptor type 2-like [Mizuhopecten yessoensis]|uniref:somatostatin receptor type 2-like n=1 Tax=Mizuhopecten yessoensis TaxID=6573 RepID=UPI000B4582AE|nr:somatostatin receptor type 2-like [Mizuhopecten yessoensis]
MSGYSETSQGNISVSSHNLTSPSICAEVDDATKVAARIQRNITPIICILGIIGNTLATIVFLSKSQRKTSCSLYLAARSISDTGFLTTLFIVCLTDLGINIFNVDGICQVVIFLTYICGFLSVWFVVMVTVENYIRICHPFKVNQHCTVKTAKIVIAGFVFVSLLLYNFPLWTTGIHVGPDGSKMCARHSVYDKINQIVTYSDTVITLIVPILMIICLMIAITCSILEFLHRQTRLKGKRQNSNDRRHSSPQSKVTRLLFSVSFVFITLTLPSHVIRIQMTLKYLYFSSASIICPTMAELAIQKVFLILYYLSFSVNILVYLSFGQKFRKNFIEIFLSNCCCRFKYGHQELVTIPNSDMKKTKCTFVQTDRCTEV